MKTYTDKETEEQYNKLPDILKRTMFSPDIANKIVGIGKKFGLPIEKIGLVAEETGYVVLGLSHPREFPDMLMESLNSDKEMSRKIAGEINVQIFFPIREALKQTHGIEIIAEVSQPSGTIPQKFSPHETPKPIIESLARVAPTPSSSPPSGIALRPAGGIEPHEAVKPIGAKPPTPSIQKIPPIDVSMRPAQTTPPLMPQQPKIQPLVASRPAPTPPSLPKMPFPPQPPKPEPIQSAPLQSKIIPPPVHPGPEKPQSAPSQPQTPRPQPVPSPFSQPKIPPVDLRGQAKPPPLPQVPKEFPTKIPPINLREQKPAVPSTPPTPPREKKTKYEGFDPYRESKE